MYLKSIYLIFVSIFLICTGLVIILTSSNILRCVINNKIILTPNSSIFNLWNHFPSLVPMDFYFFNWTNPEELYNKTVKPKFQQVGPYRYMVDLQKSDIIWNDNGTLTFRQKKHWYYSQEGNNGNLQDKVTAPNIIAVGAAHVSRTWSYVVRKGLSLTLNRIAPTAHVTHTVDELLFKGYPDALMKIANTLPFFVGADIPRWDRFGWFYMRNGSSDFDGVYNMGTGVNSIFGKLYSWNYWTQTPYFEGRCGKIDGSTGDRFDISNIKEKIIKIFSPEACRPVTLQYDGTVEIGGIMGEKYIFDDYMLDNGTKYKENGCFCNGECRPSGVFNVSSCRAGSPAFGSLPHFYKADPYYQNLVEGLRPEREKHEFYIVIEPYTGLPLQVKLRLQINIMVHHIPAVTLFENVPEVFIPVMWFDHQVKIPEKLVPTIKLLLNIPNLCIAIGISSLGVGITLILYVLVRKKKIIIDEDIQVPLKESPR